MPKRTLKCQDPGFLETKEHCRESRSCPLAISALKQGDLLLALTFTSSDVPNNVTDLATGNNLSLLGDAALRESSSLSGL
jgi:hypothetical protein